MSSNKAAATAQKSSSIAASQQQPPKAPMSYSNAATGTWPSAAKLRNPANLDTVTAQVATLQLQEPRMSQSATPSNVSAQAGQAPISNMNPSAVPYKASTPSGKATDASKNNADPKEQDPEKLTFFDETYALDSRQGSKGDKFKILVNRFAVQENADIPQYLYVYSVRFPQIRGRDVKNSGVKKLMLRGILASPTFQQLSTQNQVFTDWNNTIITKTGLNTNLFTNGILQVHFPFQNQSTPGAGAPIVPADIALTSTLDMGAFKDYIHSRNNAPANFNFSEHTRALNTMARHFAARNPNIAHAGRSRLFPRPTAHSLITLPSGLEARSGFFNSIRPAVSGIQLQLNTTAAAFHPARRLIDYLRHRFPTQFDPSSTTALTPDVRAVCENLEVLYMYTPPNGPTGTRSRILRDPTTQGGRSKRISSFGRSAHTEHFDLNGQRTIVADHFNNNVMLPGHGLAHANLPVANTGPKPPRNPSAVDPQLKVRVPLELLFIKPDQALKTTVPGNDMALMGNASRRKPQFNMSMIQGTGQSQGLGVMHRQLLANNNVLHLGNTMLQIEGRKLPAPQLQYGNAIAQSDIGKWDLRNKKFQSETKLGKLFAIQIVSPGQSYPKPRVDALQKALKQYGVDCTGLFYAEAASVSPGHLTEAYNAMSSKSSVNSSVVLVILESTDNDNYAHVKTWGDCMKGVNTVCVTQDKSDQLIKPGFTANLALKFNAKLGGRNHILTGSSYSLLHSPGQEPTMVVGADVSHPGPSSVKYCPSIAAVVASTDRNCVRFPGSMRLQAGRTERILDLKDMMAERLRVWSNTNNGRLPSRILFYRDGVGEDQFAMVKRHELQDVRAACDRIATEKGVPGYMPPITMVVCTKRHANRFYPAGPNAQVVDGKTGNFKPGLIVDDRSIRLPQLFDFWLQAHQPLQGTGRPCHYFVLENGMGLTPDGLQGVTFALSWVYATSLTPISVVAPAYYADKLCERGRCYIRPLLVGRHRFRPNATQWDSVLTAIDPTFALKDDQMRTQVAIRLTSGQIQPANAHYWNVGMKENPCHTAVKDTMFYI